MVPSGRWLIVTGTLSVPSPSAPVAAYAVGVSISPGTLPPITIFALPCSSSAIFTLASLLWAWRA